MLGAQQKDGHLGTCHRVLGTVIATSTAARDALRRQLLDEGRCPVPRRDMAKSCACANRRWNIRRAVNASQQEHSHLGARHRVFLTVLERGRAAAAGNAGLVKALVVFLIINSCCVYCR